MILATLEDFIAYADYCKLKYFTEICKIVVQKVTHRGHCITVFDSELKVAKAGIIISAFCERV